MEQFFTPIIQKIKLLRIIIIGLPGHPGTNFKENSILNNVYLSKCLATFLVHCESINSEEGGKKVPKAFYSTGNGANVCLHFVVNYLSKKDEDIEVEMKMGLLEFGSSLIALLLVNPFTHIDKFLKKVIKRFVFLSSKKLMIHIEAYTFSLSLKTSYLTWFCFIN